VSDTQFVMKRYNTIRIKRFFHRFVVAIIVTYFLSYVFSGGHGRYVSRIRTVGRDAQGDLVWVPKKIFEEWEPFPLYDDDTGRPTLRHFFFFPLIYLDRKLVHRNPW
jgi:hypothetical protein